MHILPLAIQHNELQICKSLLDADGKFHLLVWELEVGEGSFQLLLDWSVEEKKVFSSNYTTVESESNYMKVESEGTSLSNSKHAFKCFSNGTICFRHSLCFLFFFCFFLLNCFIVIVFFSNEDKSCLCNS